MFTENNPSPTYYEVLERASSFLSEIRHSSFVAEWLMRERLEWTKTDLILNYNHKMPTEQIQQFEADFKEFLKGKPMQQIIGHEWYFDRKFKVTAATLIPRPETEEWQNRVLKSLPKQPLKVLDIGTGTGILAITHKLERPNDVVTATDISQEALEVAKENAEDNEAEITFKLGNLLEPVAGEQFDLILCNPPYIGQREINQMDRTVLEHEPKKALFAEDDGLAIYKELAPSISEYLKPGAQVFFEIGYQQGEAVTEIFKQAFPEASVELWQDFNQLDRVIAIYTQ
jgi:release factor glutamine methyltransferase